MKKFDNVVETVANPAPLSTNKNNALAVKKPGQPAGPAQGVVGRSGELKGKTTREGLYKCYECRSPFTVKIGTIFEDSRIKLHIWLQAIALVAASKKGISSSQLSRILGISQSSAWHLLHRIREVMKATGGSILGGGGGAGECWPP